MAKRGPAREQFYADLLDDAATACHYWWHDHDSPLPEFGSLTTDDVARGWRLLLEKEAAGRFQCCGDARAVRDAERALAAGEDADYDACVADAVVQLAVLGAIIYG